MNPLGLEYLTLYGAHPLEFIRIAHETGYQHVSFLTGPLDYPGLPSGAPSLFEDARLRREVQASLRDRGMSISQVDGFVFRNGTMAQSYRPILDLLGALGVTQINTCSLSGWDQALEQTAALVEIASAYGLTVTVENIPGFTIGTLPAALELVRKIGKSNFKLVLDVMHVSRTGGVPLIGTFDPELIAYVQICDGLAPMPSLDAYMEEALHDRMAAGEGEFPLIEILKHIPRDVIVSAEVPMRRLRRTGVSDLQIARLNADCARKVLLAAQQERAS